MNDNASVAVGSRAGLGGLPQRLVQDGVVEEAAMLEAMNAARERKAEQVAATKVEFFTLVRGEDT